MSLPPRPFGHARGTSFGKPLNAGTPVLKPDIFTFTPPNLPKCPMTQTPSQRACSGHSRVEAATMAAVITRAFHTDSGHETLQQVHDHSTFFPMMSSTRSSFSNTSDHPQNIIRYALCGWRLVLQTVVRAKRRWMQPSTRSCLCFKRNCRSPQRTLR